MATSTPTSADATATLNTLIETCNDGKTGFEHAAGGIEDPVLKAELLQYSGQRAEFAAELTEAVAAAGAKPTEGGSVAAAVHRGWTKIRDAVTKSDRYAILAECERGEDSAVAAYRKAAGAGLPTAHANLIATQQQAIQRVHDRIKALRDSSKPA